MLIKIKSDFTSAPGPRYRNEGEHSGEEFREDVLQPKVRQAVETAEMLTIDLDGTSGFGTSFLEESFGGLIRECGLSLGQLNSVLRFKSEEEPELIEEITEYLNDAEALRVKKGK
jgi:hypothetical protein